MKVIGLSKKRHSPAEERMMSEHNLLYVVWRDYRTGQDYIAGRLERTREGFSFEYSDDYESARKAGCTLFVAFPEIRRYESRELFAIFQSRLHHRKRVDIDRILEQYGLEEYDGFDLLRKSGGRLPIDHLSFVEPAPGEDGTTEESSKHADSREEEA